MVRKDWHAHSACVSLQSSRGRRVLCYVSCLSGESRRDLKEKMWAGTRNKPRHAKSREGSQVFSGQNPNQRQEETAHPSCHAGVKLPFDTPPGCQYFASVNLNPSIRTRKKNTSRDRARSLLPQSLPSQPRPVRAHKCHPSPSGVRKKTARKRGSGVDKTLGILKTSIHPTSHTRKEETKVPILLPPRRRRNRNRPKTNQFDFEPSQPSKHRTFDFLHGIGSALA